MKGVFADSQTIFGEALLNSVLPSNTYGHVSGGLPEKIPGKHQRNITPGNILIRAARFGNLLPFWLLFQYFGTSNFTLVTLLIACPKVDFEYWNGMLCLPLHIFLVSGV